MEEVRPSGQRTCDNCSVKKAKGKDPSADVPRRDDASDAAAFELEMADVVRLGPDPRGRVRSVRLRAASAPPAAASSDDPVDSPDEGFAAAGVDRREIRKLRRGEYAVGDSRDLHGMTAAEACATAARFIESSRHSRHRCVCIVHGRGLHSEGKVSVLRARVRGYLRSHRAVLAYANAPQTDGGAGAVYVLLRK
jgi:DNA-nicking Smr family endonuclease